MATLLHRLDAEIASFTESFANLVKASRVDMPDEKRSQVVFKRQAELLFDAQSILMITCSVSQLSHQISALCPPTFAPNYMQCCRFALEVAQ